MPPWAFSGGKECACQCKRYKRRRFDPWVRKILWVGNGNPLQYSRLGNFMERGAWMATVHGVTKSQAHSYTCRIQINIKGKKQMEICSLRICIK